MYVRLITTHKQILLFLYTWSIFLEPLSYFVISNRYVFGFNLSVSRILQVCVLLYLFILFIGSKISFKSLSYDFYESLKWYSVFLLLAVLTTVIGLFFGEYDHILNLNIESNVVRNTYLSQILHSPLVRINIEIIMYIYNFLYFTVLFLLLIRDRSEFKYILDAFYKLWVFFIIIGIIDYIGANIFSFEMLTRQIGEETYVAKRFHSIAGEPRHAVVFAFFSLGILYMRSVVCNYKYKHISMFFVALLIVFTAESASALVAIMFTSALIIVLYKIKLEQIMIMLILGVLVIYFSLEYNARVSTYLSEFYTLFDSLKDDIFASPNAGALIGQMRDIYPVIDRVVNFISSPLSWNIYFGSGANSSTAFNNIAYMTQSFELLAASSFVVRLMYEYGVVGTIIFSYVFIYPMRSLASKNKLYGPLYLYGLIIFGFCMIQKSVLIYIFLAIFLTYKRLYFMNDNISKQHTVVDLQDTN